MRALSRHRSTVAVVAVVALLGLALLAFAAARSNERRPADPPVTSTSSTATEAPTTSTSSSASTSTPVTVAATSPATTAVRSTPPAPAPGPTSPANPAPTTPATTAGPCDRALVGVRAVGLPPGFEFFCSAAKAQGHAGLAYYNSGGGSFVAISPATGDYEGVGAHEACHAQQFVTQGSSSEAEADACAAAHGWPNPYAEANDTVVERPGEEILRWLEVSVLAAVLVVLVAALSLLPGLRRRLPRKDRP